MTLANLEWLPPTLPEWLASVEDAPQEDWLLDKLVPKDALVLLSGQQKLARKSLLAESMMLVVASGKPWDFLIPNRQEPQAVLYLQEEGSKLDTYRRLLALCRGMGLAPNVLDSIRWSFRAGVKLDLKEWRDRTVALVEETKPALIVLDSMFVLHSADENSSSELKPVYETFQAIRKAAEGGSIVYLAHLDKGRGMMQNVDHDLQVRGSSTMVNIYDVHLAARRYKLEDDYVHLYTHYRDSEPAEFDLLWSFASKTVKAPRGSDQKDRRIIERIGLKVKEVLADDALIEKCIDRLERGTEYRSEDLRKVWKLPASKAMDLYARLLEEGILERTENDGCVRLTESSAEGADEPEEKEEQRNKVVDSETAEV